MYVFKKKKKSGAKGSDDVAVVAVAAFLDVNSH